MTTIALPQQKQSGWFGRLLWALIALPWHAIKVYPPVLLIASSAAYASSEFAAHRGVFPEPFNIMQAIAFEWVYLGALALAGGRRGHWFYVTVGAGALTSALYMLLHAADRYGLLLLADSPGWRLFYAACHAVPLTIVGVSYMLMIHTHVQDTADKAEKDAQAAEQKRIESRYGCSVCSHWHGSSVQAFYGHKRGMCGGSVVDSWQE